MPTTFRMSSFPASSIQIAIPELWGEVTITGDTTSSTVVVDTAAMRVNDLVKSITLSTIHQPIKNLKTYFHTELESAKKKMDIKSKGKDKIGDIDFYWFMALSNVDTATFVGYFMKNKKYHTIIFIVPYQDFQQNGFCNQIRLLETIQSTILPD